MARALLNAGIGAAIALLAGCDAAPSAPAATSAPPFALTADDALLMDAVIDPAADVIWNSVATIISEAGTEEIRPRSDEEWAAVRRATIVVAEAGNLLMLPARARDEGDWRAAALGMIKVSQALKSAAEQQDADKVFALGGDLYSACLNCHQKYIVEKASP